ncbi:hypothetical protein ACS0TY_034268 [Phlomoides rotata]
MEETQSSKDASDADNIPTIEDKQPHNANPGDGIPSLEQINSSEVTVVTELNKTLVKPPLKPPIKRKTTTSVDIIKKEGSRVVYEIWGHFNRLENSDPLRAACNYCGTSYAAHPKANGTTSMWAHLETSCKKYPFKKDKSQKTLHDIKYLSENLKGNAINFEELRRLLAEMIIIDGLPF